MTSSDGISMIPMVTTPDHVQIHPVTNCPHYQSELTGVEAVEQEKRPASAPGGD